ncbi:UNVERIFIED_CONTAM: hypothetical protein Sradi_3639100 [Sesamum radiatum]|uniref:Reverse transcriptase zinc-binding domain-containing protein n=1 Tax=Sesamum radiatum TaxID=300843 RepID=A0AAW2QI22_SESRA
MGLQLTDTTLDDSLNSVIVNGDWQWPPITDLECLEILHSLPTIHEGHDKIVWRTDGRSFTNDTAYKMFQPRGPKVVWTSLLLGPFKIPTNNFILWLAILKKLSTLDKPWLNHLDCSYVLCIGGHQETNSHIFLYCRFSCHCLGYIRQHLCFAWPNRDWDMDITWATKKWRGKHLVNIAY